MSNINIKRAVENIRNTTVYTPIIEVIVNAIQAIQGENGQIILRIQRAEQGNIDGIPEIQGFEIEDNGVGFTDENRESFDTLYSDLKIREGGKGFGRFTCLKYFKSVDIESFYKDNDGKFKKREFSMGEEKDIIINERISEAEVKTTGTKIRLISLKDNKKLEKKIETIAKNLVQKLLPFFLIKGYSCPEIYLSEISNKKSILLNDYLGDTLSDAIEEIHESSFDIKNSHGAEETFSVKIFKFFSPDKQKSKISLVAHKREVVNSLISHYIPEFTDEFYEIKDGFERNYIIKAYVFSEYLDKNVSIERGGFNFQIENDLFYGISQKDIERQAANISKKSINSDISSRQERKKQRVKSYIESSAPWHKSLLNDIDLTELSYHPDDEVIELFLQKAKISNENENKRKVKALLDQNDIKNQENTVNEIVKKISGTSRDTLIHYIASRKSIIDIFEKSLMTDKDGRYKSEGIVHDIIFPRKKDTDTILFEDHNLWIIDERLNFTSYVSSDKTLDGGHSQRPDLIAYNQRILFREDNIASNPVTIFEFKKPQRDDFVNPSSKEDPIQQIIRYVNSIRDGEYKTPEGREIIISKNTPFYGYVICDLTRKVKNWLDREKNFKPMPDNQGWFQWIENINLYVEVLHWDKVLNDAKIRNKIFFQKLGI